MGDTVVPYAGSFPQIIASLTVGSAARGFDLDQNGTPDNRWAGIGSLTSDALAEVLETNTLLLPLASGPCRWS